MLLLRYHVTGVPISLGGEFRSVVKHVIVNILTFFYLVYKSTYKLKIFLTSLFYTRSIDYTCKKGDVCFRSHSLYNTLLKAGMFF